MRVAKPIVPTLTALVLSAGCTGAATPAVTVTVTVTPSSTSAPTAWAHTGQIGAAPSPPFPTALEGWRLTDTWSTTVRAFEQAPESWASLSGPDAADFPSTMNGCGDQRFLVRWRSVDSTAQVASRWVSSGEALPSSDVTGTAGEQVIANAGWMDIDGCETPQFRLASADGGATLTDITVDVQQLNPAP